MKNKLSMTILATGLAAILCTGCSSVMDPTNAQARADKMQKAMDAQKHNGMMTAPKGATQAPAPQ